MNNRVYTFSSPPPHAVKLSEEKPDFHLLTYLLSFFSGGDFLSQPWKMISPPLMFDPSPPPAAPRRKRRGLSAGGHLLHGAFTGQFGCPCGSLRPPFGHQGSQGGGGAGGVTWFRNTLDRTLVRKVPTTRTENRQPMRAEAVSLSPGVRSLFSQLRPRPPRALTGMGR